MDQGTTERGRVVTNETLVTFNTDGSTAETQVVVTRDMRAITPAVELQQVPVPQE